MSKAPEEVRSSYSSAVMRSATPYYSYTDSKDDTWDITTLPAGQTENTLGEETPGDSQTSSVTHRDAVEETTATPIDHLENSSRGKTLGDSQTVDTLYRGAVEETADSPINQISQLTITSPATSTPGSTPVSHRDGRLKDSEL